MADIYEQTERPAWWRVLWYGLWAIVVIAVLWVLVWLIFFRSGSTKKVNAPGVSTTAQPAPSTKSTTGGATAPSTGNSNNSAGTNSTAPSTAQGSGSSSTASPQALANTGPGDITLPILTAGVAGSTIYYIRLRRRLLQS